MNDIESIIRQYVILPSLPSTKGWYPILCKVCNDHGKKGPRAAFRFDSNVLDYNCFNCGHKAHYNMNTDIKLSKNTKTLFSAFGIPTNIFNSQRLGAIAAGGNNAQVKTSPDSDNNFFSPEQPITLPTFITPLADDTSVWGELAREYLNIERGIDPASYPFYICPTNRNKIEQLWYGRLIIPFYNKQSKIISFQGRSLIPQITPKYRTYSKSELTIYGYENLYENTNKPLFIVEGFFDAFCINGVAVLGNEINQTQINIINKSNRRKIYIPDKWGDGWRAGIKALKAGWEISFPDFGSCKDVNEAFLKYGKLYIIKTIMDNIASGTAAKIRLEMLKKHK